MNLILIAPPAAGKGTLANDIHEKYGNICISAGELLRGVDPETEIGKMIRDLQSRRELVNDELVNKLIEERLSCDDIKNGFINKYKVIFDEEFLKKLRISIIMKNETQVSWKTEESIMRCKELA